MKIPFYYSYHSFLKNWENDFEEYLKVYPNCPKDIFLKEIKEQFSLYKSTVIIEYFKIQETYPDQNNKEISEFPIFSYTKKFNKKKFSELDEDEDEDYLFDTLSINDECYNIEDLIIFEDFFDFENGTFKKEKYKDFLYSIPQIHLFIDNYFKAKETSEIEIEETQIVEEKFIPKIKINGDTALLGYIFKLLIDGDYIVEVKKGIEETNKIGTARMLLDHFDFVVNPELKEEYLKKCIYDDLLANNKAQYITIPHINKFN